MYNSEAIVGIIIAGLNAGVIKTTTEILDLIIKLKEVL